MGINVIPPLSTSDDWVLISSVTPTGGASTVSFTSISGYRKLMFRSINTVLGSTGSVNLTFNSDTGTKYSWTSVRWDGTILSATNSMEFGATNISLSSTTNTNLGGLIYYIDDTDKNGIKRFTGFGNVATFGPSAGGRFPSIQGDYLASAPISTVTLTSTTTFTAAGTVSLYGVKV